MVFYAVHAVERAVQRSGFVFGCAHAQKKGRALLGWSGVTCPAGLGLSLIGVKVRFGAEEEMEVFGEPCVCVCVCVQNCSFS